MITNGKIYKNPTYWNIMKSGKELQLGGIYGRELDKINLLSREEELTLIGRASQGDLEARNRLIVSNLRLVPAIAKIYAGKGLPYDEIVSAGNLGLVKAVENIDKYDHKKARLNTYVGQKIRGAILDELENYIDPKVAKNDIWKLSRIDRLIYQVLAEKGRAPTIQEISKELRMKIADAENLMFERFCLRRDGSPRNSEYAGEDSSADYMEIVDARENPERDILSKMEREQVRGIIRKTLSPKQLKIIELRFGMNGYDKPLSFEAIGKILKNSGWAISRTEKQALRKLRQGRYSKTLSSILKG